MEMKMKRWMACVWAVCLLISLCTVPAYGAAAGEVPGELYTVDGEYYYAPLEQGVYSKGGYTLEKVSHPDRGAGELDSIIDPEERGQSYSWSMAEYGDYVYIGTCYNSTYYIYYTNVLTALKAMQKEGTISSTVDVSQVTMDILEVAFGVDAYEQNGNPMSWKPVIMAVNKHTGEAEVIFRESEIISQHPEMFPHGYNVLSGYRMAFAFKGKLYFAGMGNPTATLVEVDPLTNDAKIVYYNINRSNAASTAAYGGVSNGVHGLLVFDDEILMCLATDDLNRDGSETLGDIGGIIVASSDPSAGLDSWRVIGDQADFDNLPAVMQIDGLNGGGIWDIIEYNGSVYVTVVTDKTDAATGVTNKQGFALYRGDKQEDDSFVWTQLAGENEGSVLPFGFGVDYSMSCNMWVFDGYLYFGTYNDPMLDLAAVPATGNFEPLYHDLDHSIYLYRMDAAGNFEMVGGKNDNPSFPEGPIGNLGEGLGSNSNQYVWRYGDHQDELYIGTYDTSTLTYMFTQLTDGQVKDMSEEDISGRAAELENALLGVLEQQDNKLLKAFLESTILSKSAQKLLQELSGLVSSLTTDWNPVPQYNEKLANYEVLKKLILDQISLFAAYSVNDADVAVDEALNAANVDDLMNILTEAAEEQEADAVYLTVDEFVEGLSEEEIMSLYADVCSEQPRVSVYAARAFSLPDLSDMKEKLKTALREALETLFAEMDKIYYNETIHNFVYYFGVNYYAQSCEPGFDLLVSKDGVNFDAITRNGFGDEKNHGLRTITSTDQGVFMGTANPFQGTQLWRMYSDRDLPLDTDEKADRYNITITTDGHGTASASQATAVEGKYVTLTATPNKGYEFDRWEVLSPEGLKIENDRFCMPGQAVQIKAYFTGSGEEAASHTLTFETNGGSSIAPVTKEEGTVIALNEYKTTKDGSTFEGWYADQALQNRVDEVTLTGDTTVYAKWTDSGSSSSDPSSSENEPGSSGSSDSGEPGNSNSTAPDTGDHSQLGIWPLLAVISLLCAGAAVFTKAYFCRRR